MKKIAVISTAPTQFKSLLQYAFILRENFEVVFYFDDSQDAILNETELADKHGFRYYFHIGSPHFKEFAGKEARDGFRMPLQTRMLKRLFPGSAIVQALCNNHYHEHHAKVFMEFYKPDIILSAQDNFGITPVFVKLAKKNTC